MALGWFNHSGENFPKILDSTFTIKVDFSEKNGLYDKNWFNHPLKNWRLEFIQPVFNRKTRVASWFSSNKVLTYRQRQPTTQQQQQNQCDRKTATTTATMHTNDGNTTTTTTTPVQQLLQQNGTKATIIAQQQ